MIGLSQSIVGVEGLEEEMVDGQVVGDGRKP